MIRNLRRLSMVGGGRHVRRQVYRQLCNSTNTRSLEDFLSVASQDDAFPQEESMNASLTRIYFHLICIVRRPSRWQFFVGGIGRELNLMGGLLTAKA
jgi:hypothetical protein